MDWSIARRRARLNRTACASMARVQRLVIADAHVGQRAGDVDRMCRLVERAVATGIGELLYLGDVFQYLIGMEKFWTPSVIAVLASWRHARESGVRVVVVEGNRDFFLDGSALRPYLDWGGRRYDLVAGPRRVRLVHGDLVNQRDCQYRFWAAVSKSAVARLWARLLPAGLANRIVRSMEDRLARTNRKYRYTLPLKALEREARQAWGEGIDIVMWGHFHSAWQLWQDRRFALVVPAWLETGACVLISDEGDITMVSENLTPLGPVATMHRWAPP